MRVSIIRFSCASGFYFPTTILHALLLSIMGKDEPCLSLFARIMHQLLDSQTPDAGSTMAVLRFFLMAKPEVLSR